MPTQSIHIPHPLLSWKTYRKSVFPSSLPLEQERECSKAFYAGMLEAIVILTSVDPVDDDDGELLALTIAALLIELRKEYFTPNPWLY